MSQSVLNFRKINSFHVHSWFVVIGSSVKLNGVICAAVCCKSFGKQNNIFLFYFYTLYGDLTGLLWRGRCVNISPEQNRYCWLTVTVKKQEAGVGYKDSGSILDSFSMLLLRLYFLGVKTWKLYKDIHMISDFSRQRKTVW